MALVRWRRLREINGPGPDILSNLKVRAKKLGIGLDGYTALLKEQDGRCAICRHHERTQTGDRTWGLSMDHDHTTGRVRGLLCNRCNRAIGLCGDDPAILERAAQYLRGLPNASE